MGHSRNMEHYLNDITAYLQSLLRKDFLGAYWYGTLRTKAASTKENTLLIEPPLSHRTHPRA